MNEKDLKTSWKQRVIVSVIAFLMLFSTVAVYVLIVLSSEKKEKSSTAISEELKKMQPELRAKEATLNSATKTLSDKYYANFLKYKEKVKSYNATSVASAGLKTNDLVAGDGEVISNKSSYYSYYIGWCADESVFDSSFNNWKKPTALKSPIPYNNGESKFIAGWEEGVLGMKVGGVREINIPGELAYGNTREICGGKNSPLKYIVMIINPDENYKKAEKEYQVLSKQYYTLYYQQHPELLNQ